MVVSHCQYQHVRTLHVRLERILDIVSGNQDRLCSLCFAVFHACYIKACSGERKRKIRTERKGAGEGERGEVIEKEKEKKEKKNENTSPVSWKKCRDGASCFLAEMERYWSSRNCWALNSQESDQLSSVA